MATNWCRIPIIQILSHSMSYPSDLIFSETKDFICTQTIVTHLR